MSDTSIPAPNGQHKPVVFLSEDARLDILMRLSAANALSTDMLNLLRPPCDAHLVSQESYANYDPIEYTLYSLRTFGFTHPSNGRYLMVPKEFRAILVRETKAVATVIWEIMQQTIGWEGDGPGDRREWAVLTFRHFVRARLLSKSQAQVGIKQALEKHLLNVGR